MQVPYQVDGFCPMAFGWLATSLIFGTLPHENHGNLHYSAVNMKSGSLCEFTACKKTGVIFLNNAFKLAVLSFKI